MSNLGSLLAVFDRIPADELRLVAGEPPSVMIEGQKRHLGSQVANGRLILATAAEVFPHDELLELPTHRPRVVRHTHGGSGFVIEVARAGEGVTLVIRPVASAAARAEQRRVVEEEDDAEEEEVIEHRGYYREAVGAESAGSPPSAYRRDSGRMPACRMPTRPLTMSAPPPPPAVPIARIAIAPPSSLPVTTRAARAPSAPPAPASKPHLSIARGSSVPVRTARATVVGGGPRRIDELLHEMVAREASDLHLSSDRPVAMRIHGEMTFLRARPALSSSDIQALVREIMTPKAASEFDEERDADFAYEVPGLARFRVNVFEDRNGVGTVMRQIPIEVRTAEELDLPKACLDLCSLAKGLVVVTGPTGSGKSTTLAAMVDHINKTRTDHIITIEDPVEFVHTSQNCLVNQREVGAHTKNFKNALRAALREDPDIVLVGEMRDLETIAIAIETAETGHLVFGTLHTTTAVGTVDRIVDQFPPDRQAQIRVMLSESLKGVVAQNLCKRIGGGRVAAHEILLGTPAVSALVREGKTFQLPSVMQTARSQGMVTMNDSLLSLVQRKLIDPREAWLKAVDKSGLVGMFKAAGVPTAFG